MSSMRPVNPDDIDDGGDPILLHGLCRRAKPGIDENLQEDVANRRPLVENMAHVRLFEAGARIRKAPPCATLAAQLVTPSPLRVIFADPTDVMTYATSAIHINEVQASELEQKFGDLHVELRHPPG